jgi:hypothetical protein
MRNSFGFGLGIVALCGALVGCQAKTEFSDKDFEPRTDLLALTDEQMARVESLVETIHGFHLNLTGATWSEFANLSPGGTAWADACEVAIEPLEIVEGSDVPNINDMKRFGSLAISGGNCPVALNYSSSETVESGKDSFEYRAVAGESPLHSISEWKLSKSVSQKLQSLQSAYYAARTEAKLMLRTETGKAIEYVFKERTTNQLMDADKNLTIKFPDFTAEIISRSRGEFKPVDNNVAITGLNVEMFVNGVAVEENRATQLLVKLAHFSSVVHAPYLASSDNRQ